ncbi:MAG: nickel pincer cofactor biosynthesis protein LarC [Deltaproteobacteria bacterium]|nr:nickel pincer cofactor biosynthesis protein LarC [Deltaproteobacteria bacterium]
MKTAYLDCFSGVSGDMFLGALLDAGLPFHELRECLLTLPINGYQINIKREARNEIFGTRFLVSLDEGINDHRGLKTIREVIAQGDLSETVKEKSIKIFESLAKVEGEIHNRPPEEVHFHEVGAVDSIIDIVGTVYALERLHIESLYVSPLPLGSGFVMTAHGKIPVPAPATIALLKGVPVFEAGIPYEMVTPTGAALIKGLAASFGSMPPMVVQEVGYGVGTRDLPDRPNLLRILIGEEQSGKTVDTVVVLETNVDDIAPECLGYLMDRLFDAGALDVVFFPVQMKKNRPGVQIQVIGKPDKKEPLMEIMVRETATLGIRFRYSQRRVLPRAFSEVDSPWGRIKVKKVMFEQGPPCLKK